MTTTSTKPTTASTTTVTGWRAVLPIHPAAELFPLMTPAELRELGEDIKTNGLRLPIAITSDGQLLDGRNRLDAMEAAGVEFRFARGANRSIRIDVGADRLYWPEIVDSDPYAYVISANIHRRHLTAEQRQHLLIALIARAPQKSDRQIGGEIGVDHKTIASARAKGETTGEISPVEKRVGKDGKSRRSPAHKPRKARRAKGAEPSPQMGPPEPPRDDIGPDSASEAGRLRARNEELEREARRLEIENKSLRRDVEDLRRENAGLRESLEQASGKFIKLSGDFLELRDRIGRPASPAALPTDDGLDPSFLDRTTQGAAS